MVRYRAIVTPTHEGPYVAVVPEMPGISATGRNPEQALARAADALREAVRAALRRGEILQPPDKPDEDRAYIEVSFGDLAFGSEHS
jgi:predicted RNase H-like HicB family nuclease